MSHTLRDYFAEKKLVNRSMVLGVALAGVFAGACLMFIFALQGLI